MAYGKGELPPKSFFEKMTLELVAMPKVAGSDETVLD
jgi:hypothetical protein